MCHATIPADRSATFETTVAQQRAHNIHVHDGITQEQFVSLRKTRDATLICPYSYCLPCRSISALVNAPTEANGVSYLKIPLNAL